MKKALILCSVASMIEQFNVRNIQILQKLGCKVFVVANFTAPGTISVQKAAAFKAALEEQDVKVYDVEMWRSPFHKKNIQAFQDIKKIIARERFDLIHCQSPIGGVLTRLAAWKQWREGTAVIYTAHGFHFYQGSKWSNWAAYYPLEKLLSRFTSTLITINQEDYARAQKLAAQQTLYLPGIGMDLRKFQTLGKDRRVLEKTFGIKEEEFVLLSVGELNDNKNHEVVLRALPHLDFAYKYLICGLGEKEEELKALVEELGVADKVIFAGYRGDVLDILKASDAFVFPSKREGLSVALMEAMACGVPVVCSEIRGNTDLIIPGEGGILIGSNDPKEYAAAITRMYEEATLREGFSRFSLNHIKQFDASIVDGIMEEIYAASLSSAEETQMPQEVERVR